MKESGPETAWLSPKMRYMDMERQFETDFARKLYFEVSAFIDVNRIKRRYISQKYIWKLWKKTYMENCGYKRIFYIPGDE